MKKVIAMLACLTLVLTMFAGLSASAAGEATMTAQFKDYVVSGSNVIARVEVYYKVPDTMVPFTSYEDDIMMETYWTGTGIASSQFALVSSDSGFAYFNAAKSTSPLTTSSALANKDGLLFSAGTTHANCVATGEGLLGVVMFKVDPASYANSTDITFKADSMISVRKVVDNTATATAYRVNPTGADKQLLTVGCTIPAYETPSVDTAVTFDTDAVKGFTANAVTTAVEGVASIDVTPAFGYKIASVETTDGTVGTYNAAGGKIEITGLTAETATVTITTAETDVDAGIVTYANAYVDGNNAVVFGKVPAATTAEFGIALDGTKYAAEKATADKAFGIAFEGLEAGSYTAAAYAGDATAVTTATVTIAE